MGSATMFSFLLGTFLLFTFISLNELDAATIVTTVINGNTCELYSPCQYYTLGAKISFSPNRATNYNQSFVDPFTFAIPSFFNITAGTNGNSSMGNSGQGTTTFAITLPSTVVMHCTYQGIGVFDPQTSAEKAAANAYAFQSCDQGSYNAGSLVTASNIQLSIDSAGNTYPGVTTEIVAVIHDESGFCVDEGPGGTATSTNCAAAPTSTLSDNGGIDTTTNNPANGLGNHLIIAIAASVGGAVALFGFVIALYFYLKKRRMMNRLVNDLQSLDGRSFSVQYGTSGKNSKRGSLVDGQPSYPRILRSAVTTRPTSLALSLEGRENDELEEDDFYGEGDDIFVEGEHLAESDHNYVASRPSTSLADQTLLNDREVIALPAFLKLEYHDDLREVGILSEGGAGIIFVSELLNDRLRQKYRTTQVAVKVPKLLTNWTQEQAMTAFSQEVSIIWSLNACPYIIEVLGFSLEPMALVTRVYDCNLFELILDANQPLSLALVWKFSIELAEALRCVHEMGIAHRDLKSANILINMRGTPSVATPTLVLTDFGLAQITDHNAITVTGQKISSAVGISCRYAAPELWQAIYEKDTSTKVTTSEESIDQTFDAKATDIYAFAVVIWELLFRAVPWKDCSNETIRQEVIMGHRPSQREDQIRQLKNETERLMYSALSDIMQRAWDQQPSSRPHLAVLMGELLHLHDQFVNAKKQQERDPMATLLLNTCGPHFMKAPRRLTLNTVRRRASIANHRSSTMRTSLLNHHTPYEEVSDTSRPRSRAQSHYTPDLDQQGRPNTPANFVAQSRSSGTWSPSRRRTTSPIRQPSQQSASPLPLLAPIPSYQQQSSPQQQQQQSTSQQPHQVLPPPTSGTRMTAQLAAQHVLALLGEEEDGEISPTS